MRDEISIGQLETFIACARMRSFSAAARKLNRTESFVSLAIAKLEAETGVVLFDRSAKLPVLTLEGRLLLTDASNVTGSIDRFRARAQTLAADAEAELAIAVDGSCPIATLNRAVDSFHRKFPQVPLRVQVEGAGSVAQLVLDGRCRVGVLGPNHVPSDELEIEPLMTVPSLTVVSSRHPLASYGGTVPRERLEEHLQLVACERVLAADTPDWTPLSPSTWRLADLEVQHEFIRAGFGWGRMPTHRVANDIRNGLLTPIHVSDASGALPGFQLSSAYRRDAPPGPGGRWLLGQLGGV